MPEAEQAAALRSTLRTVNDLACWVSQVAFARGVPREYELRKHTYPHLKAQGLGAQAAQHVIKKVRDAYTTLHANLRAGNLGKPKSRRRVKAESKPIAFRAEAAQPYDDRCLSWQYDQQTVSIWTMAGRIKNVSFVCLADALKVLQQYRKGESDLIERDGVFYLIATCDVPEAEAYEPDGFIGVDLGIVNIATTSTGYQAAGRGLGRYRTRQLALRAKLQKKRTKSAKRRLKERSRREQRHVKNTNHIIAKTIVTEAERTAARHSPGRTQGHPQAGTAPQAPTGRTPLLGLRPARRLHRLQGQAGRRAPGLRRSRVHVADVLAVPAHRQAQPCGPGAFHLPGVRGRCPRRPECFPQHRPTRRERVECGA